MGRVPYIGKEPADEWRRSAGETGVGSGRVDAAAAAEPEHGSRASAKRGGKGRIDGERFGL